MRLAWLTDIHLNFVDATTREAFLEAVAEQSDAVVVTGDIGEGRDVALYLEVMARAWQRPIYFVLGNHDFYRSSITRTRQAVAQLAAESEHLVYLTDQEVVQLTPRTALLGHDGWADARLGDFQNSDVILSDYGLISDLNLWLEPGTLDKPRLREVLHRLGDEAAASLETRLAAAADRYAHVLAATHVPPFREATWHEGRTSDDNWLPHFSCQAVGEALLRVMRAKPDCELLVLCGHTHGSGEIQPLPNLRVLTGGAVYGKPALQRIIDVA